MTSLKNKSPNQEQNSKKLELLLTSLTEEDGHDIYQLIKDYPPLELNSLYAYLMLAKYFSKTSLVAKTKDHKLIGFI